MHKKSANKTSYAKRFFLRENVRCFVVHVFFFAFFHLCIVFELEYPKCSKTKKTIIWDAFMERYPKRSVENSQNNHKLLEFLNHFYLLYTAIVQFLDVLEN